MAVLGLSSDNAWIYTEDHVAGKACGFERALIQHQSGAANAILV
jgi:hypothetical protein